ncbi:tetratricopeptide repeat protein [Frankia sp. AgB32]|uniref:tetratricopeptide repeat protein n=1 Tax=Frankia sp. AgB32 TaxID=631119 RepID=UPI00200DBF80|nr:tetratricopeptide repeat protein [Frankia sp. AgB32]MCK9897003.1 tetratricopeptide repeat protein [Frankia sp. AgB32]
MAVAPSPGPGSRPEQAVPATGTNTYHGPTARQDGDHNTQYNYIHNPPTVVWPAVVGQPPMRASAFQPRQSLRERVVAARGRGEDVVLTQPMPRRGAVGSAAGILAGGGGVGKSQLAAWFAHDAMDQGTDLVVWVAASSPEQIITTYARAAVRVGAPGAVGTDPTADAAALVEWLHTTDRSWLIVLDDITDPTHLTGRWPPHRRSGWTLATTRLREAALASSGRSRLDVDMYTPAESAAYLTTRLAEANRTHLLDERAADLATAVGHLPLALSHAAAYLINQEESCTTYLARYTTGDEQLTDLMPADADPDAYGRPVAITLLLGLDAADAATPAGLARPALALAALCDPDGHPDTLWTTTAFTDYLSTRRGVDAGHPVTADQARKTLRLLDRYGLLTHTPGDGARAVRVHALTARATQEATADLELSSRAVANALLNLWPAGDHTAPDLVAVLRRNTATLAASAGKILWQAAGHPLLYRSGFSLLDAGLHAPAVAYWHHLAADAARILGEEHPDTLTARASLASSYWQAGRTTDAITIQEQVLADAARILGEEHPHTLAIAAALRMWRAES